MFMKNVFAVLVITGFIFSVTHTTHAANGTWTDTTTGGLWSSASNPPWAGGAVADGAGFTADFSTLNITSDNTVHLDTARTIGNLHFGDTDTSSAAGWILNNNGNGANILTLSGGSPTITVDALAPVDVFAPKSATISGVVAGSSGLTKEGAGRLKLTGTNTYTGGTVINGGTLAVINNNNLGATPGAFDAANITLNNGAMLDATATADAYNAGNTVDLHANRGIVLGPGTQILRKNHRGIVFHIRGVISGLGGVIFDEPTTGDDGGGSRTHVYGANTYTGDTRIRHQGNKDPGLWLHNALALQNSTLDFRTTDSPANAHGLLLWFNSGVGTSTGFTLGGLKGNKNLNLSPQGNTARNLKIGNNNQDTTYTGVISSSNDALAGISKIGTGKLTLTGNNTYTGPTNVMQGVLEVNGSLAAGSSVLLSGGALGGTGTINGPITLAAGGGAVAPGASIGTLNGASLTWNSDDLLAGMDFELSSVDDASDRLNLSGAFTKGSGSSFLFDFSGGLIGETYTLVQFGSTNFAVTDFGVASGIDGTFDIVGNSLQFTASAANVIPEPQSILLAACGLLGLMGIGIRKRRRK